MLADEICCSNYFYLTEVFLAKLFCFPNGHTSKINFGWSDMYFTAGWDAFYRDGKLKVFADLRRVREEYYFPFDCSGSVRRCKSYGNFQRNS